MRACWLLAPLVTAWALASSSAFAAGECPLVVGKDPAFAAMVTLAIAQGPAAGGPAGTIDCKPGTTLQIYAAGDHNLAVTLDIDTQVVGKRQLDFATEPKPFDAAEAVALAYREMAANLPIGGSAAPTPPNPTRVARPTSEGDRPKRVVRGSNTKAPTANDQPEEERPAPPPAPTTPPVVQPVPVHVPPPLPAVAEERAWNLALAPTLVFPENEPMRFGTSIDLGRDLGNWWVAHGTATLAPFRARPNTNEKNVRLYSFALAAGPQLSLGRFHAALLGGVGLLVATAGSTDTTAGIFGDIDLAFDATSRVRIGMRAGLGIAPDRLQEPCPSDTSPTLVPPSIVRATLSLGFLF
jgi:hypothetical protein